MVNFKVYLIGGQVLSGTASFFYVKFENDKISKLVYKDVNPMCLNFVKLDDISAVTTEG